MSELRLTLLGMTCERCAETVAQALEAIPGVRARVAYPEGVAWVQVSGKPDTTRLLAAVRARGFEAEIERHEATTRSSGDGLEVVIIGSGAAAMAAAVELAGRGARVTVVERGVVGGTCVNIGCVPSKILLQAAHAVHGQRHPTVPGVRPGGGGVDWPVLRRAMLERVAALRAAKYESLIEAHPNIRLLRGQARFLDERTVVVATEHGERRLSADGFLVATGARSAVPRLPGLAGTPFWTATEALFPEHLPESLLVLGGGVVACELAQAHARLGAKVTLVARSGLLSRLDAALGAALEDCFTAEGIEVVRGEARAVRHAGGRFLLALEDGRTLAAERLLVAVGRQPNTEALGLAAAGIAVDETGAIRVDDRLATSRPHIYAAGDCTDRPRLVYVAARAGVVAARNMLGGEARLDLGVLPQVVFTDPQAAVVGARDGPVVRELPLEHVPRALAAFDTRGFLRLAADETGRLLGARILSPRAGEVIQSAALALAAGMTVKDLADRLFPYLTEAEGLKLAAQTFDRDLTQLSCCAG